MSRPGITSPQANSVTRPPTIQVAKAGDFESVLRPFTGKRQQVIISYWPSRQAFSFRLMLLAIVHLLGP
jgi:hypothetical protein